MDILNRHNMIYHSMSKFPGGNLFLFWTKNPDYKDLVISDGVSDITIKTEQLPYLIQAFAKQLEISTQDGSKIQGEKPLIRESGSGGED